MADDDVEVLACTSLILASVGAATAVTYARKKRKHKTWVNEYIRNRDKTFNTLLPQLCAGGKYFQYLRMDVAIFEELYTLVEPERKLA